MKTNLFLLSASFFILASLIPAELAADPPPPPPATPHKAKKPGRTPAYFTEFISRLPQAEQDRLNALAKEDPAAFRQEIKKIFRMEHEKRIQKLKDLRQRYLQSSDPEEKKRIEAELRANLDENFDRHSRIADRHIATYEAQIKRMEQHLQRLKEETARRKNSKDQIIDHAVKQILDPDSDPSTWLKRPPRKKK